jgi:hypothetical protein
MAIRRRSDIQWLSQRYGSQARQGRRGAAAKFIEGASSGVQIVPPADEIAAGSKRNPAMIRFDTALLARVDKAAKRRGVSRSAWVAFTLSKALDDEEQA